MSLKADAFLSAVLGKPAYHLSGVDFAPPDGRAFVDVKVSVEDTAALLHLQARGFAVMDTNVQLLRPQGAMAPGPGQARAATAGDAAAVKALAAEAFIYDRFHRDPAIGRDTAAQFKAEWAGNYFGGARGDRMIVAEDGAGLCGFLQLLRGADGGTVIDLVAVSARSRGQGLAHTMIALAANAPGTGALRVGTQIANLPSLALYAKLGFSIVSASYVLHLHTGEQP